MFAFFGAGSELTWLIIAGIVLLLFGNRLPQVMRGMGQGISEFKRGLKDIENDVKKEIEIDVKSDTVKTDSVKSDAVAKDN